MREQYLEGRRAEQYRSIVNADCLTMVLDLVVGTEQEGSPLQLRRTEVLMLNPELGGGNGVSQGASLEAVVAPVMTTAASLSETTGVVSASFEVVLHQSDEEEDAHA